MVKGFRMMSDKATTAVAGAWVVSPAWFDHLQTANDLAVLIVTPLSALWILLKIARLVWDWRQGGKASD